MSGSVTSRLPFRSRCPPPSPAQDTTAASITPEPYPSLLPSLYPQNHILRSRRHVVSIAFRQYPSHLLHYSLKTTNADAHDVVSIAFWSSYTPPNRWYHLIRPSRSLHSIPRSRYYVASIAFRPYPSSLHHHPLQSPVPSLDIGSDEPPKQIPDTAIYWDPDTGFLISWQFVVTTRTVNTAWYDIPSMAGLSTAYCFAIRSLCFKC